MHPEHAHQQEHREDDILKDHREGDLDAAADRQRHLLGEHDENEMH